ncbi:MAG: Esa1p-associated factor [Bathelium mastoideum]|nr:MAG: Esa1p-associated factor [Bathelium mastoideum]KAI9684922.1 MAG: Esa1p-associated factor [Bathelium mastoideum]
MAPANAPAYAKDEKVLCFHHELLYEAKVLDSKAVDPNDKKTSYQYRVHYKGWKNTWDDWVPQDRLRKLNDENKELAANLKNAMEANRAQTRPSKSGSASHKKKLPSDVGSMRGSEERATMARGQKRGRDFDLEKEEAAEKRPIIRLFIPDNLKEVLVDDWERVTKNLQLVSLPSKTPVSYILSRYFAEEIAKRRDGSAEADVLEEVRQGIVEYFNRSLGKILLYRFEREQLRQIYDRINSGTDELAGKTLSDVYGGEHLCRLLVSFPELIGQTNMDGQSVERLKRELSILITWLNKNIPAYLSADYENASQEYIDLHTI